MFVNWPQSQVHSEKRSGAKFLVNKTRLNASITDEEPICSTLKPRLYNSKLADYFFEAQT